MPSIFQVGFVALTAASTALAHLHAPYGNTTSVYLPTGIIPTGLVPTGIVPTGTGGSSSSTIHGPYTNTTLSHSSTTTPPPPVITTPPPTGQWTTSTIYTTQVETITSCPPQVTKCPYGSVTTKTIAISTTICPVTETPKPTYTVVPVPPKSVTITSVVTDIHTITKPSGEEYVTSKIYTTVITCPYTEAYPPHASTPVAPGVSHTVAPYPTGSATLSTIRGTAPIGTATGVPVPTKPYKPDGILTLSVTSLPQPTYTPPPLEQSAAGKIGVSSVLALVFASAFALLY